jgi:hypothetical protein
VLQGGPDPWGTDNDALLLQLKESLTFQGVLCAYFIATPRYEKEDLGALMAGTQVNCNLTRIPEKRATSTTPFDLSWWRGGVGLLATLQKL